MEKQAGGAQAPGTYSPPQGTSAAEPVKVGLLSWWMVIVLCLLYSGSFVDRLVVTMLAPAIKADLQLTDIQISLLLGPAFALSYAIASLPFGWASDRFPRRAVIYVGSVIWAVSTAAGALAGSFFHLLALRIGVGSGEASITPASLSMMADRFPARRLTTAMAVFQSGSQIGTAVAYTFGGLAIAFAASVGPELPLLGTLAPWRFTLLLAGAPFLLLGLLVFTFPEPPRRAGISRASKDHSSVFAYFRQEWRVVLPMGLGCSLAVISINSLMAWTPSFIARQFALPPEVYGPVLGLISLMSGAVMVLKGIIVDALYARGIKDIHLRFYSWLILAAIPLVAFAFFLQNPGLFLVLYGCIVMLIASFVAYIGATVQLFTPTHLRGQVMGVLLSAFGLIGAGLGPLLTATLTDKLFRDESYLGHSLALLSVVALTAAWICLRIALHNLKPLIARRHDIETGVGPADAATA